MGKERKPEFWYDLETTGLKIEDGAAICQIAYKIIEGGEVKHSVCEYVNPYSYPREVTIAPAALETNGIKVEDFSSFRNLGDVLHELMHYLTINYPNTKLTCIGYNNSSFDKYFLEEMFSLYKKPYHLYFNWKQIDVFEIVKFLQHIGFMGATFNQKLPTIARYLKVVDEDYNWHDAGNDIEATRLIYNKFKEALL